MRPERERPRWRRPTPPGGLRRIPWGYLAAFIALVVAPLFLLLLPVVRTPACGVDADIGCTLSVGLLLWGGGSLAGIVFAAWLLRLGWLFALAHIAAVAGVFRFADGVQNLLTVGLVLLIPGVAALASIPWRTPWYKSWQAWAAAVASVALIVWVGLWIYG
ncbi:hypothetical protein [Propionicicella superfundia]|uniref:hypothetical protein n=1 Tax=Propionicicella superfundia TaxID=348582 RepID=UPI00040E1003|nr:hypothetical protein [Propionicicella superfundia]